MQNTLNREVRAIGAGLVAVALVFTASTTAHARV